MKNDVSEERERAVLELCQRRETAAAVDAALKGFGPEIRRFLMGVTGDVNAANEIYSIFSEDVWKGLNNFRWESSFRTWAYRLAWHATSRFMRSSAGKKRGSSELLSSQIPQEQRSATQPWLRTDVKRSFRELRARLPLGDRVLLILRVDRKMAWPEIARVMHGDGEALDDGDSARRATALRQQFQRVKARLRSLAIEEGLIPDPRKDD